MEENALTQIKIVIAEDNMALADIYSIRLDALGYKCFVAHDGQEAIEVIEREKPALVLLDLMMPRIAGDEVLRRMRETEWGKDIRVYIISNLNESDAPAGLRQYGIEGYTVKMDLKNDDIDKLVDSILKPATQTESTSLEN
jgi:two-component system, OmpR family, response regulator VicR